MFEKFDCTKNYVLEDDRAVLRPLQQEDFNNLLPFSLNEPYLWKYSLAGAEGEEGLQNYMNITFKAREEGKEYPFIVFDKLTNEYAGSTRFYDIQNELQTVQLGYTWYGKKFQGTGLNKHCKYLLLSFAFEKIGFERFELRADNNNERSIAAMKSLGCKVDGILRSNMPTREADKRRDSIVLSILKDEWFGGVKETLKKKLQLI
ncbi:MAG: GNAT family N-acetyltransferase [Bacteroidota bacterium]|nr:GNAT family N-acetyltransferase [Bacteroidota bacterium]